MQAATRILVRAPNWVGDLVMATPGFRALRAAQPSAEITLHVRPALAPLVAGAAWFDRILPLASYHQGASALAREALALREQRFDLGICLPDSFSSALLMWLAGVDRVVGYRTQGRRSLLDVAPPPPASLVARERHVLDLVAAAGCPPRGTELELFVTSEEEERAEALLAAHGIAPSEPLVALAPGAAYGPSKHWPAESFARVGDALSAAGMRVVVIGAPDEAALAARVVGAMHESAASLAGALDLGASKAVLRRARVLVCNDAGARHIAVALGTPSVVLLGPTSLAKTNLNLERVHALETDVECRPCYHRVCPIDHRCMTRIPPDTVTAAALSALEDGAPSSDRSQRARFPRSEPQASGAFTGLAAENGAPSSARGGRPRFPRSEPQASGAFTRLAVENGAPSSARSEGARFPRSEPKASGEFIRPEPDLSIVLLTWNGRDLTIDCLASIEREIRARDDAGRIETETIVVDNGSIDGTVDAVRERLPWARVLALPANRGFAGGHNAGLALATGRHVCLLNNDTIVQRDGLEACVRFLDAHPDAGVVGPALFHADGRRQNSIHNFPTLLLEVVPRGVLEWLAPGRYPSKRFAQTTPIDVEAILGACLVVRRDALAKVGPLPEDYFFFLEETDWCCALREAGFRVVHLPDARLVHIHGAATKKVVPLATRIEYHRSLYHFFEKRRGAGAARAAIAIRLAKLVLALVVLAPAALVSVRERARWRQRGWILAWHLVGRPVTWGLSGVGSRRTASGRSAAERAA